jgi:hypothetical protein
MTRPSDVKPREGEVRGTSWDEYVVGDPLPEMRFTLTPDVIREYETAINCEHDGHELAGEPVAVPSVLCVYLMAVLYRKYPPAQGGIMAANDFEFHAPLRADVETDIVADGRIEEKFEKRGRQYVRYSVQFRRVDDGELVATAVNTSTFPAAAEQPAQWREQREEVA